MRRLDGITLPLLVIGGLNWLLVGIFEWDLVAAIFGEEFGTTNWASRLIYIIVGICAVYWIGRAPGSFVAGERKYERDTTATTR
jgi:uncharacterized protein